MTCILVHRVGDILDRVAAKFCELELEYNCLGGGRIEHRKDDKSILVYGYSMVCVLCCIF